MRGACGCAAGSSAGSRRGGWPRARPSTAAALGRAGLLHKGWQAMLHGPVCRDTLCPTLAPCPWHSGHRWLPSSARRCLVTAGRGSSSLGFLACASQMFVQRETVPVVLNLSSVGYFPCRVWEPPLELEAGWARGCSSFLPSELLGSRGTGEGFCRQHVK